MLFYLDETLMIHVSKQTHKELTIHAISHATMAGDTMSEILDFECTLHSTGKETTKGSNKRGKASHHNGMELYRGNRHLSNVTLELQRSHHKYIDRMVMRRGPTINFNNHATLEGNSQGTAVNTGFLGSQVT